jgi:calcineurin-like phosphoesterase family protein
VSRIFVISDTHFDHANILTFTGLDGTRVRPEFASVDEMNEAMVARWNDVVRAGDHVYHLGDVAMAKRGLRFVAGLNGRKRLVRGNHDIFKTRDYLDAGFDEIHGMRVLAGVVMTHCPIHPESLGRFIGNVHGHIHERPSPAGRYANVSVERINYAPVLLDAVVARLRAEAA